MAKGKTVITGLDHLEIWLSGILFAITGFVTVTGAYDDLNNQTKDLLFYGVVVYFVFLGVLASIELSRHEGSLWEAIPIIISFGIAMGLTNTSYLIPFICAFSFFDSVYNWGGEASGWYARLTGKTAHADAHGHDAHADPHGHDAHADPHGHDAHADVHGHGSHAEAHGHGAHADPHGHDAHADAHGHGSHADAHGHGAPADAHGHDAHADAHMSHEAQPHLFGDEDWLMDDIEEIPEGMEWLAELASQKGFDLNQVLAAGQAKNGGHHPTAQTRAPQGGNHSTH